MAYPRGVILPVKVRPNARATAVTGWDGDTVCIAVAAPPVDDRANAVLVRFLARTLGVPRRDVTIRRGATSRTKHVELPDGTPLEALGAPP